MCIAVSRKSIQNVVPIVPMSVVVVAVGAVVEAKVVVAVEVS